MDDELIFERVLRRTVARMRVQPSSRWVPTGSARSSAGAKTADSLTFKPGIYWRCSMLRLFEGALLIVGVLSPATVFAQASIVGTVRDASGALMPGVTVEASSPALIEKARSVVTNGAGQYSIEDLFPGTYRVTFTIPGFNTVLREGIVLTGSFIATVNADMK